MKIRHKIKKYLRRRSWKSYLRKAWTQAKGDWGDFLSNVGFHIAYRNLPKGILDARWRPLHRQIRLKQF